TELVEMARLIAALEIERGDVRNDLSVLHAAKLPSVSRNGARCAEESVTHDQRVRRAGWVERRIAGRVGSTAHIAERAGRIGRIRSERRRYPPGDWFSLIKRGRRIERHQAAASWNIELPSDPDERVALPHEEAVAEIRIGGRVEHPRCAVEIVKDVLAPSVEDGEQHGAICARGVLRSKDVEIGRKGHAPGRIARRLVEIDDDLVAGMLGIDREEDLADELLVRSMGAKRLAAENVRARRNLDSRYFRLRAMTDASEDGGDHCAANPQHTHCDPPIVGRHSRLAVGAPSATPDATVGSRILPCPWWRGRACLRWPVSGRADRS